MTDEAWGAVMALPSEERDLVRHCTLGSDDLDRLRALRVAHNQLGHALLLCAMRHPGRALAPGERPPAAMVAWVARQLGVEAARNVSSTLRQLVLEFRLVLAPFFWAG